MRVKVVESRLRLATNIIFITVLVSLLSVNYFFVTPATSFHICNQDLLLMDIRLLQDTRVAQF